MALTQTRKVKQPVNPKYKYKAVMATFTNMEAFMDAEGKDAEGVETAHLKLYKGQTMARVQVWTANETSRNKKPAKSFHVGPQNMLLDTFLENLRAEPIPKEAPTLYRLVSPGACVGLRWTVLR
jgi:hypothetical protein